MCEVDQAASVMGNKETDGAPGHVETGQELDEATVVRCVSIGLQQEARNDTAASLTDIATGLPEMYNAVSRADLGTGADKESGSTTSSSFASVAKPVPEEEVPLRWSLSSLNPWSRYRKDVKVRQGKLDGEADEHGHYRYYDSSLSIALLQTTRRPLLLATFYKASRAILDTTSSLVTKQLIAYITTSHAWSHASEQDRAAGTLKVPKHISHAVGLAVGLALMQQVASLCGNHYHLQSFGCGKPQRSPFRICHLRPRLG